MIEVEIDEPAWTAALPRAATLVRQAATATLKVALYDPALTGRDGGIVVLLTSDATVQGLNARFLGKTAPTNVLSFPATPNPDEHLGDIALAFGVCAREAETQRKSLADHLRHLTTHGVLHLLGYDHQIDSEAEAMEALERRILEGLGVADPFGGEEEVP